MRRSNMHIKSLFLHHHFPYFSDVCIKKIDACRDAAISHEFGAGRMKYSPRMSPAIAPQ
jgi:hypothetical protein